MAKDVKSGAASACGAWTTQWEGFQAQPLLDDPTNHCFAKDFALHDQVKLLFFLFLMHFEG